MRKYLNNPKVVLPLALVVFLYVAYSYGLLDQTLSNFSNKSKKVSVSIESYEAPDNSYNLSIRTLRSLSPEKWLKSNWKRRNSLGGDPFVATYDFSEKKELVSEFIDVVDNAEETVIVDQQTFEAAIASKLGLDGKGYFVVFENVLNLPVRKRVGDTIYLVENGALKIPTFGIAERARTAEEKKEAIELALAKMNLQGVGIEPIDSERVDNAASQSNTKNIAFIQVEGNEMEIYEQGDLVHRNPSLGLDKIVKGESVDRVELVDAELNIYILTSSDLN